MCKAEAPVRHNNLYPPSPKLLRLLIFIFAGLAHFSARVFKKFFPTIRQRERTECVIARGNRPKTSTNSGAVFLQLNVCFSPNTSNIPAPPCCRKQQLLLFSILCFSTCQVLIDWLQWISTAVLLQSARVQRINTFICESSRV